MTDLLLSNDDLDDLRSGAKRVTNPGARWVDKPGRVMSGTYASATITTTLSAGAKAKGAVQDSTAAGFTVTSVTPKRISARLSIQIEDVAAVGQANLESILRENLSLVNPEVDPEPVARLQAYFFAGQYEILAGDDEAAADWFWRVIQSGDVRALTYAGARAELGRLGKLEDQTPE